MFSLKMFTVLDKTKFQRTKYVTGGREQRKLANLPRFKGSQPMGGDLYEVKLGHKRIRVDLPMQVIIQWLSLFMCFQFTFQFALCHEDSIFFRIHIIASFALLLDWVEYLI